jgi:hypothetical protein
MSAFGGKADIRLISCDVRFITSANLIRFVPDRRSTVPLDFWKQCVRLEIKGAS